MYLSLFHLYKLYTRKSILATKMNECWFASQTQYIWTSSTMFLICNDLFIVSFFWWLFFFFFVLFTIIVAFHTYYSSSNEFSFCLLFMYVINNTWYTSHRNGINLMILLRMVHWAVSIEQLIYLNKIYFKCMDILNTLLTNKLNLIRWSMHWFANFSVLHFIVDISHTYIHNIFW